MARKKEAAKPMFSVKGEFTESLDALCHEAIMFLQAVEQALQLDQIKEGAAKDILRDRAATFRSRLTSDD